MANNPLDELVQASTNPVTHQPVMTDVPNVPTSSFPATASKPSEVASEIPSTPSPSIPLDNPLDQLISGATNPDPLTEVETKSAVAENYPKPPSTVPQAQPGMSSSTPLGIAPTPTPAPTQANPSIAPTSNPLDSLIHNDSSQKPIESHSALDQLVESASEEKEKNTLRDVSATPMPPKNPSAIQNSLGITENPISLDLAHKPTAIPSIPEHDIAPMSPPLSPPSPPITSVAPVSTIASSTIKPAAVATMHADQAPTLSKKELEEKAKKLLKDSPPKGKSSKKPWILALLTLLIVVGAAGGGLLSYQLLNPTTNNETAAVAPGYGNCVMQVTSTGAPNESAGFGYKPASANVSDATRYYDVAKGEKVDFNVSIKNTSANPVSAIQRFYTVKVLESPIGTPVTANSPLDEATLIRNHQQPPFDKQANPYSYKSPDSPFTLQPGETKLFYNSWRPTDLDCGLYQIDMNVEDTAGVAASCEPDFVAAAGFVRVVGCQELCGKECSSNSTCEAVNESYACHRTNQASAWADKTADVAAAGTGDITCFNAYTRSVAGGASYNEQHIVRDGKIWSRDNQGGNWKTWADTTANVNSVGTGRIQGFSSFVTKEGYIQQHLVRGGKIWARNNEGGSWQPEWQDVSANVASTGSGEITGLNSFLKDDLYQVQFLVRGNEVYRRDSRTGWSEWEKVTPLLNQTGTGNITCYSGHDKQDGEVQRLARGGKLWEYAGDWFGGTCRLASNPTSQTCAPAPTPEALACTSLTKAPPAPKLGEVVTFTCAAAPAPVAKYEFRYKVANGNYASLTPETANPNTAKLTVTSSGAHKVECRACDDAAATSCTTWGLAK